MSKSSFVEMQMRAVMVSFLAAGLSQPGAGWFVRGSGKKPRVQPKRLIVWFARLERGIGQLAQSLSGYWRHIPACRLVEGRRQDAPIRECASRACHKDAAHLFAFLKEGAIARLAATLLAIILAASALPACGVSVIDRSNIVDGPAESEASSQPALPAPAQQTATLDKVAQTYTAMTDPKSKAYKVGPLDVLDITVFRVPELSRSVQVSEAGTINFPLIGQVQAGGKSARELEQDLAVNLGKRYLRNPQISVFVKDYNSQRVTVTGAVKKPGVVAMAGGMTLMQAIAQAGGLDELAERAAVVFRAGEGRRVGKRYDLTDIDAGNGGDPQLQTGDVIVVPVSNIKYGMNVILKLVPLASAAPLL